MVGRQRARHRGHQQSRLVEDDHPSRPGRDAHTRRRRHRLLDHDFRDPQAAWTVPARVIANGRGAEFLITFFQPAMLDDEEFDRQAALVDTELAALKHIIEIRQ